MKLPVRARGMLKTVLSLSQAKLVYSRIRLTRYTSLYFLFTVFFCLILCALQGVLLSDNTQAVNILQDVVDESKLPPHLTRIVKNTLEVCNGIPHLGTTVCTPVVDLGEGSRALQEKKREIYTRFNRRQVPGVPGEESDDDSADEDSEDDNESVDSDVDEIENIDGVDDDLDDDDNTTVITLPIPSTSEILGSSVETFSPSVATLTSTPSPQSPTTVITATPATSTERSNADITAAPTSSTSTERPAVITLSTSASLTSLEVSSTDSSTPPPSSSSSSTRALTSSTDLPASPVASSSTTIITLIPSSPPSDPIPTSPSVDRPSTPPQSDNVVVDDSCAYVLSWLEDGLHNSQREDAATLFSHLWMAGIGVIAVLNESLPHLVAAFFAHILQSAWSISRIQSTRNLAKLYRDVIVPGPCNGKDYLGGWWDVRLVHTIPIVVLNVVGVLVLGFFSWRLYTVYANQTFSRVGSSPAMYRMYKLLLAYTATLELSSFLIVVSGCLWINKISHADFADFASHWKLYVTAFAIIMVMAVPWLVLGWRCMRKESIKQTWAFLAISLLLVGIVGVMLNSKLYRVIFERWPYFSSVTVTSYVLLVVTFVLGIACRLNFNKGLVGCIDVSESPEGADFSPVNFKGIHPTLNEKTTPWHTQDRTLPPVSWDWDRERDAVDAQPISAEQVAFPEPLFSRLPTTHSARRVPVPEADTAANATKAGSMRERDSLSADDDPFMAPQELRIQQRGASVYSDNIRSPIQFSMTPPLLAPLPAFSGVQATQSTRAPLGGTRETVYSVAQDSVVSLPTGLQHPPLVLVNPDAWRESQGSSVVRSPVRGALPVIMITRASGGLPPRGVAAPFPSAPRRF